MSGATPLRVLSLGAGVQSTALLLMVLEGTVRADAAVFADTRWEPVGVYEHLWNLASMCAEAGFPLYVVTAGDLRADATSPGRFASLPFFVRNADGSTGLARRQCTNEYKIAPIRRMVRELLGGDVYHGRCTMLLGISTDEWRRVSDSRVRYVSHEYPLLDAGMSRLDCLAYLAARGITAPRSACIGCPFHSAKEWMRLTPEEVADAADFERHVQLTNERLDGTPYLHRSLEPIDRAIDLMRRHEYDHPALFDDECAGVCGV